MCDCGGGPSTIGLLQSTPLYAYLDDAELELLAGAFVKKGVKSGKPVPDSPFYIVLSGEVEVRQENVVLCTKHAGMFFSRYAGKVDKVDARLTEGAPGSPGEDGGTLDSFSKKPRPTDKSPQAKRRSTQRSSLMRAPKRLSIMANRDKARNTPFDEEEDEAPTEVRATKPSQVLVILPAKLAELKVENASIFGVIQTMSHANVEKYLAKVPFIRRAALGADQLRTLGELGTYVACDSNTVLFNQGEKADAFYVLLHGQVEAWLQPKRSRISVEVLEVDDPVIAGPSSSAAGAPAPAAAAGIGAGAPVRVAVFGAGDHIGESALVVEGDRSATVKIVERAIFFKLEKANFAKFMSVAPALEKGIILHTKERLLQVYRQAKIPFFAELTDKKVRDSARHAILEHYDDGQVVCRKGEEGVSFYVVVGGQVQIETGGEDGVKTLSPGGYFGEMSMLLHDRPVIATCKAHTRTTLLQLPRDGFVNMFSDEPELAAYMRIKILRNHCTINDILTHSRARELFRTFLKSEYADESLAFSEGVAAYKALSTADERKAAAKKLVDEFLPDGAPRQINIPSGVQKAALTAFKSSEESGELPESLFDHARKEVLSMVSRDSLPRFFKTDPYTLLLEHFGSYDVEKEVGISTASIDLELHELAA